VETQRVLLTHVAREGRERPERVMVSLRSPASRLSLRSTPLSRGCGLDTVCAQVSFALAWPPLRPGTTPLRGLCLKDRSDLTARFRNPVSNDVPHQLVVDAEVVVDRTDGCKRLLGCVRYGLDLWAPSRKPATMPMI
jgi:hypothetical protein